jgi:hypothetical protein
VAIELQAPGAAGLEKANGTWCMVSCNSCGVLCVLDCGF